MKLGYITNGFRDHRLTDILPLLADLGYGAVGITLDVGHLDPFHCTSAEVDAIARLAQRCHLDVVVETGARYILDPRRKHHPTLISAEGRDLRLIYLLRAIDIAAGLGARVVSLWSGARDPAVSEAQTWDWLCAALEKLVAHAATRGVVIGFEPEPGMFIESLTDWRALRTRLGSSDLRLTLDLGHLEVTEARPHDRWIHEFADRLVNVHVDDIRDRRHDHLPLGTGQIDFAPLFAALMAVDYRGACLVELARHSHRAPLQAAESLGFLRNLLD